MDRPFPLSRHQVDAFFERGFVLVPDVFDAAELAEIRAAFERLHRLAEQLPGSGMYRGAQFVIEPGGAEQARIHRVVWCGAAEPVLSAYGKDRRLVAMAAQLLGSATMHQLINQAHFKLPGDGVSFPWHQDSRHRRYGTAQWRDVNGRGSYVQSVLAVDEITPENGPLRVIPGSNLLGHVDTRGDGELPSSLRDADAQIVTQTPGSVLLFGPYTYHGSEPNLSDRARRVFINGFAHPLANSRTYPGRGAGRLLACGGTADVEAVS